MSDLHAVLLHHAHTGPVHALQVSANGSLISGAADGRVLSWHPSAPDHVQLIAQVPSPVYCVLELKDLDLLLIGTSDGELFVLAPSYRQVLHRFTAHSNGLFALARLPGQRIAAAGGDGSLSVWALSNATATRCAFIRSMPLSDAKLRGLALSPKGDRLAVACGDGAIRILETDGFNEVATCAGHLNGANAVVYHPGKPVLMSGGKDGHLRVWNTDDDYRDVLAIPAHRSTIYGIAFDPSGLRLMSASRDKTVKLWDARSLDPITKGLNGHHGHTHSVNTVCWTSAGPCSAGDDRKVLRWQLPG